MDQCPPSPVENPLELAKAVKPGTTDTPRRVTSITTAPRGLEGEGFPVRRAFAASTWPTSTRSCTWNQMGEVDYGPGEPKGTPWHPHRGFETVTYMIDGTFLHQDSIGGGGVIQRCDAVDDRRCGDLHIERPPDALIDSGGLFHGIPNSGQPAGETQDDQPPLSGIEAESVSLFDQRERRRDHPRHRRITRRRRRAGSTHTPIAISHVSLLPGAQLSLPWNRSYNALTYVLAGQGSVDSIAVRSPRARWPCTSTATSWCSRPMSPRTRAPRP